MLLMLLMGCRPIWVLDLPQFRWASARLPIRGTPAVEPHLTAA